MQRYLIVALAVALAPQATLGAPLGTGFTYQGQLTQDGSPVNGTVDLRFSLWDAAGSGSPPSGGTQIGASQLVNGVGVTNGLFTVVLNSGGGFGANAYNGDARWLQIEVCGDAACGTSTVLSPRQTITATPYAHHSVGPWQKSSSNLYFNTGRVVIGTSLSSQPAALHVVSNSYAGALHVENGFEGASNSTAGSFYARGNTPETTGGVFVANGPNVNYAAFFNASGGTTNYGIWSDNGTNHFRQKVGIGTSTPSNMLSVVGDVDVLGFVGIGPVTSPTSALTIRGAGPTSSSSGLSVANSSGTPTLFVRDDRRVGIGTTSPNNTLSVSGNADIRGSAPGPALEVRGGGTTSATFSLNVTNSGGTSSLFVRDDRKVGIGTTDPQHLLQIGGAFDGHLGFGPSEASPNAGYIRFGDNTGWKLHLGRARESSGAPINTSPTGAVMTLVDQGNVGIGTTSPSQRLHVVGNICATGSIGACSDLRFKEGIAPLAGALSGVLSLQGVQFSWKPDTYPGASLGTGSQIGLIAQEVEKVFPEVVQTGSDGYKSVDYSRLTPILVEAIRELNAKNETLAAQLAALSSALDVLAAERQKLTQEAEREP